MRKSNATLAAALLCCGLASPAAAALVINDGMYTDAISISDVQGTITDVNVFVDIEHTSISDLDIYIGHQEEGASSWKWVQLYVFGDADQYQNDMTAVTFDDEAKIYINEAAPPYGPDLSFKPSSNGPDIYSHSNLLSFFDGDFAAGTWWFYVYDNATEDTGFLQNAYVDGETDAGQRFRVELESTPVPLPGAIILLGSGLGALATARRARRK